MAEADTIITGIGDSNFTEFEFQMDKLSKTMVEATKQDSVATDIYKDFTKFRAAAVAEASMSPADRSVTTVDEIYANTAVSGTDPNDHPYFDGERQKNRGNQIQGLNQTLARISDVDMLPAKGSDEFRVLVRDAKKLRELVAEAGATGKRFEDIWFKDIDKGKLSYIEQTRYAMEARFYELVIGHNNTPDEAQKIIDNEFREVIQRVETDPTYAALMAISPDEAMAAASEQLELDKIWAANNAKIGLDPDLVLPGGMHKADPDVVLAVFADVGVGFSPIGIPVGLYMGATGDDVIYNTITHQYLIEEATGKKPEKLPMWARALCLLPVAGPAYRAVRHPVQTAQRAKTATAATLSVLRNRGGQQLTNKVMRGGPQQLREVLESFKNSGHRMEIDKIYTDIQTGLIEVAEDETTLVNVLRGVYMNNKGAAKTVLAHTGSDGSPLVRLAQHAVSSGDTEARRLVTETILSVSDDLASARAQSVMKSLGVDSTGMELMLKDIRSFQPQKFVYSAEKTILDGRVEAAKARTRLKSLEKARKASAEKRAVTRQLETEAAEAPSFESSATGDAHVLSVEDAPIDSTVKLANGDDVKVVEKTENTVVVATSDGLAEIPTGLKTEQMTFIEQRVIELGDYESVLAKYDGQTGPVGDYARQFALKHYGAEKQVKTAVQEAVNAVTPTAKTIKLGAARKQLDDLETKLLVNAGDATAKKDLMVLRTRLEQDIKNYPTHENVGRRIDLLKKLNEVLELVDDSPVMSPEYAVIMDTGGKSKMTTSARKVLEDNLDSGIEQVAARNNASGQTAASLEALSVEKSRKAQGIKMWIVDTRTGQPRPTIGVRPEDNVLNPFDQLVEIKGDLVRVVNKGSAAKPMTEATTENMWAKIAKLAEDASKTKVIRRKGTK